MECPAGRYCLEGALSATECPLGTFRPNKGGAQVCRENILTLEGLYRFVEKIIITLKVVDSFVEKIIITLK